MAIKEIRVGIIGANVRYGWASSAHIPALRGLRTAGSVDEGFTGSSIFKCYALDISGVYDRRRA